MFTPIRPCFGKGMASNTNGYMHSAGDNSVLIPPITTSTPVANANLDPTHAVTNDALSGVITDLARQIGESITNGLKTMHLNQSCQTQLPAASNVSPSLLESSQLKVVVQSEPKAPPFFKGDSSDAFSIREWEGMMKSYLSRANSETSKDKYELLMSRLTGKARDVVEVSLRCRPKLSESETIDVVFDILKQHYSELKCSNMPMRDFYSIVPRAGEDAMDYWIRLNKSIDAVDECLRRRGKSVEDPSTEVVMMFISHCPDPALSLSFQMKAPEEWTASEIQRRLDSRVRQSRGVAANAHTVAHTLFASPSITSGSAGQPPPHLMLPPNNVHLSHQPQNEAGAQPYSSVIPTPPSVLSQSYAASSIAPPEPVAQQMVSMFDKVLSLCTASVNNSYQRASRDRVSQRPQQRACQVCSSSEHTTHSHCRLYRLCLNCYEPGHMRNECNQNAKPKSTASPSKVDLN